MITVQERSEINMTQIQCTNVALGYDGKIVTKNINCSINKGDFLCVVGENGSGKSTLIKAILRLAKPLSGKIEYGMNFNPTKIGYLPQQTAIQKDFPATVREIVMSGCSTRFLSLFDKEQKKTVDLNMDRLGILPLSKKCFRELSGGQQQRVFLARALCAAGDMLVLDEPASGLDTLVTSEMYEILTKLNRNKNMTVIMVSHDISDALKLATHILHIGNEQLFFGTTNEYINSPAIKTLNREGTRNE